MRVQRHAPHALPSNVSKAKQLILVIVTDEASAISFSSETSAPLLHYTTTTTTLKATQHHCITGDVLNNIIAQLFLSNLQAATTGSTTPTPTLSSSISGTTCGETFRVFQFVHSSLFDLFCQRCGNTDLKVVTNISKLWQSCRVFESQNADQQQQPPYSTKCLCFLSIAPALLAMSAMSAMM